MYLWTLSESRLGPEETACETGQVTSPYFFVIGRDASFLILVSCLEIVSLQSLCVEVG